jgi:hypothetical protein
MFRKLVSHNKLYILLPLTVILVGYLAYQNAHDDIQFARTLHVANASGSNEILNETSVSEVVTKEDLTATFINNFDETLTNESLPNNIDANSEQAPTENVVNTPTYPDVILPYYKETFAFGEEWTAGFGAYSFKDDKLRLGGDLDFAASLIQLEGAQGLSNYTFNVVLDWHRGGSVSIIARLHDFNNHVSCSFFNSGRNVAVVHTIDGERFQGPSSPELPIKAFGSWQGLDFGIRVEGSTVHCLSHGESVLRQYLENLSETGGPAVSIWSPIGGEALVTIQNVELTES